MWVRELVCGSGPRRPRVERRKLFGNNFRDRAVSRMPVAFGWGMHMLKILAHVLTWMFLIGMAGTVLLVIPVAAYQLFSVLFQKDHPHELDPSSRR